MQALFAVRLSHCSHSIYLCALAARLIHRESITNGPFFLYLPIGKESEKADCLHCHLLLLLTLLPLSPIPHKATRTFSAHVQIAESVFSALSCSSFTRALNCPHFLDWCHLSSPFFLLFSFAHSPPPLPVLVTQSTYLSLNCVFKCNRHSDAELIICDN